MELTADVKLHKLTDAERVEDKSWDVESAKQLEVVCIAVERSDAAVDRKLILMRRAGQGAA